MFYQSTDQSINQPINPSINQSIDNQSLTLINFREDYRLPYMCITTNNECKEKLASRYNVMLHKVTHCAGHDLGTSIIIIQNRQSCRWLASPLSEMWDNNSFVYDKFCVCIGYRSITVRHNKNTHKYGRVFPWQLIRLAAIRLLTNALYDMELCQLMNAVRKIPGELSVG